MISIVERLLNASVAEEERQWQGRKEMLQDVANRMHAVCVLEALPHDEFLYRRQQELFEQALNLVVQKMGAVDGRDREHMRVLVQEVWEPFVNDPQAPEKLRKFAKSVIDTAQGTK